MLFANTETISMEFRHRLMSETDECVNLLVQSIKSGMDNLHAEVYERNFAEVLECIFHDFHETIFANQSLVDYLSIFEYLRKSRNTHLHVIMQFEYCCLCENEISKEFMRGMIMSFDDWYMPIRLLALFCTISSKALAGLDNV
jgi:hypothetical protein